MANKIADKLYACSYCGTQFSDPIKADSCRDGHDLIYVALSRTDLSRLIQFIHLGNEELLTPSLVKNLRKYMKGS